MTTNQKIKALNLWRREKLDTWEIARRLGRQEHEVYNALAQRFVSERVVARLVGAA